MINLITNTGTTAVNMNELKSLYKAPQEGKTRSREDSITNAQRLLIKYLDMSVEDTQKIGDKYGYYGGMVQYLLKELNLTHDEAYEKGILDYKRPVDKCDQDHKKILDEYRRIRIEKGIKEANRYFLNVNTTE